MNVLNRAHVEICDVYLHNLKYLQLEEMTLVRDPDLRQDDLGSFIEGGGGGLFLF